MKKIPLIIAALAITVVSCQKMPTSQSVSLNASSKIVSPGETVAVTAQVAGANTLNWTVSPTTSVSSVYAITTETTNYLTFNEPGIYTVAVNTRNLPLDSIHLCNHFDHDGHHVPDSLWNHHVGELWHAHDGDNCHGGGCGHPRHVYGGHGCHLGQDSATIVITVRNP